jgi:hypothetical protein
MNTEQIGGTLVHFLWQGALIAAPYVVRGISYVTPTPDICWHPLCWRR